VKNVDEFNEVSIAQGVFKKYRSIIEMEFGSSQLAIKYLNDFEFLFVDFMKDFVAMKGMCRRFS